jgi:uncharacterized RDD family membrane protein YckC
VSSAAAAGLGRRLASLAYESLLVFAVVFFGALIFPGAATRELAGWPLALLQVYLFLLVGLYFVWCWTRAGQTLPMKTWKLRLESRDGTAVGPGRACARYVLACLSLLLAGAGFAWALFDRDRQFLHDRLAGTRIVFAGDVSAARPTTS